METLSCWLVQLRCKLHLILILKAVRVLRVAFNQSLCAAVMITDVVVRITVPIIVVEHIIAVVCLVLLRVSRLRIIVSSRSYSLM